MLNLKGTVNVTDEGVRYLARMKQLREVNLTGTRVTEEGLAELHKALPRCKVVGETSPSLPAGSR